MADEVATSLDVQALWAKHEDIAMHFNDLLMRLRSQGLAGIAAVSTLVGLFSKEGIGDIRLSWEAATAIFVALAFFWIAIWCLDFLYYNRLLIGAVTAITRLEESMAAGEVTSINMSKTIEEEFTSPVFKTYRNSFHGVLGFYVIVFLVILSGAYFCHWMRIHTHASTAKAPAVAAPLNPPVSAQAACQASTGRAACAASAPASR